MNHYESCFPITKLSSGKIQNAQALERLQKRRKRTFKKDELKKKNLRV